MIATPAETQFSLGNGMTSTGSHTSKQIDGLVHGLGALELDHSSLTVTANEPLFEFPWLWIFQILVTVFVLQSLVRGWAGTFLVCVGRCFRIRLFILNGSHIAKDQEVPTAK